MAEKIAKRCFLQLFGHSEAQILHASILFPSEHLMAATLQHSHKESRLGTNGCRGASGAEAGVRLIAELGGGGH